MVNFCGDFRLSNEKQIQLFFPKNRSHKEAIKVKMNRLRHFISSGMWINRDALTTWTLSHRETLRKHEVSRLLKTHSSIYRRIRSIENGIFIKSLSRLEELKSGLKFFWRFIKSPLTVGSLFPSSSALAKTIVKEIPYAYEGTPPRRLLEVGPGTGIFTDAIIKKLGPDDTLDLVEFDPTFAEALRKRYAHLPQVRVIEASILDHSPAGQYDYIVSGLPLNAFDSGFVGAIFKKFDALLKDNGRLSYFEYMWLPRIKQIFVPSAKRQDIQKIFQEKASFYARYPLRKDRVWKNLTPARVLHHHKISRRSEMDPHVA